MHNLFFGGESDDDDGLTCTRRHRYGERIWQLTRKGLIHELYSHI